MATAPDALSIAAGTPSPEATAVAQPQPAMPAAPPAPSGSMWGNVLKGALIGLMGGAGAPTAARAFGQGAAAAESQIQNDKVQAAQDKANSQKNQDAHMLASAQYANATLNHQILQANYDKMPKNLQQELEQKQWESASQLENMGALVGNPYKSQGDAMAAATAFNQNAASKGDKFSHAVVLERQDGTYGVYSPTDQKNSEPISLKLADGSTVTVPPGQMDGKTYLSTQVAIAKDKFDKSVQQAQQAETSRHNKAMESIAADKADNTANKGASNPVIGFNPQTGERELVSQAEAQQKGLQQTVPVKESDIEKYRTATAQFNDVQINVSRYRDAVANFAQHGDPNDLYKINTIINEAKLGGSIHIGSAGAIEIPGVSSLAEAADRVARSAAYKSLSPAGKGVVDGYIRTMAAVPAYQKALTGIGRSNKEMLDLELRNIPDPTMAPADMERKLQAFQENIDQGTAGIPRIQGVPTPKDVRQRFEGANRQQGPGFNIPKPFGPRADLMNSPGPGMPPSPSQVNG